MIYLDHAATTPLDKTVFEAMRPYFSENFYNPSGLYSGAQKVADAIDHAREQVAAAIGCVDPRYVFFTSGCTESNNWVLRYHTKKDTDVLDFDARSRRVLTTQIEHKSVLKTCDFYLLPENVELLPPDKYGYISPASVLAGIQSFDPSLVSVMAANNEVGTINDIGLIADICQKHHIFFHTDATQAIGAIPINMSKTGIDYLSLSAHKFYGPKGVGVLACRDQDAYEGLFQMIAGGQQQMRMRGGTENVPGIIGLGAAIELATEHMEERNTHVRMLRDQLIAMLVAIGGHVNGDWGNNRLPNNVSVYFHGIDAETMAMMLNIRGICVSTGSACTTGEVEPSHVLEAMGVPQDGLTGTIRMTLGCHNTMDEIVETVEVIKSILKEFAGSN